MAQTQRGQLQIILLEGQKKYNMPENYLLQSDILRVAIKEHPAPVSVAANLGDLQGLYWAWKQIQAPYICVNFKDILPELTEELLEKLYSGKIKMILPRVYFSNQLQEVYRSAYYGFDFRLMLSVLKKEYPGYYRHAKEKVLDKTELIEPGGIFEKKTFNKICTWMFHVLQRCAQYIPLRRSEYQNLFLEHLGPYLFTIYVSYWKKKNPYELETAEKLNVEEEVSGQEPETLPSVTKSSAEEILSYLFKLVEAGKMEEASAYARKLPEERKEVLKARKIFEQYERERRYYKLTQLDKEKDWQKLLMQPEKTASFEIRKGSPRLLIFEWNSIGNNVNVQALRDFGFECHTIRAPYKIGTFDEDILDQLNRHLDFNRFDAVFSLNCIGIVAEACYTHDIPYIAWCYDSPTYTGRHWYLLYPTTYVFLFDSDDAKHYEEAKIPHAYYMPLAVNLKYFEEALSSKEDSLKYKSDISFVGSLYDSSLPKAMGYLTDYQKAYLNALMDNQIDVYGYNFFPGVLSQNFMEWLGNPRFNQYINLDFEKDMKKSSKETAVSGRLQILLNKQTTNKERILLLNLLAKYHEVKLYSYKNSEALKGLTFCGTADYYTEMPKIFRHSKINLNATLRSIQNGIPLRCLDIMGCHGLLLTNYQKDFDDHFADEKNVLFYTDAQEALEKANFYIAHDSLREKVAQAGYETVKKYYDYPVKLKEIFEMAGLEHLIPKVHRTK